MGLWCRCRSPGDACAPFSARSHSWPHPLPRSAAHVWQKAVAPACTAVTPVPHAAVTSSTPFATAGGWASTASRRDRRPPPGGALPHRHTCGMLTLSRTGARTRILTSTHGSTRAPSLTQALIGAPCLTFLPLIDVNPTSGEKKVLFLI